MAIGFLGYDLPFADGTFDVVTCLEAMEFMSRRDHCLHEMLRVLRPGGLLFISNRSRIRSLEAGVHVFSNNAPGLEWAKVATLTEAIQSDVDPRTGRLVFGAPTVAALLVFFVFALQCISTLAIMARETNSWRWPAFAFSYLLVLAYVGAFVANRIVAALVA